MIPNHYDICRFRHDPESSSWEVTRVARTHELSHPTVSLGEELSYGKLDGDHVITTWTGGVAVWNWRLNQIVYFELESEVKLRAEIYCFWM